MSRPWAPERLVSPVEACSLLELQFPELAPVRLEPLGAGFDNTAYLANGEIVFRFPRRQLGAGCMEAEILTLPHLASKLPLPVPDPVYVGQPADGYPWSFAGYRLLAGKTACKAALDAGQRARLAEPLGRFLARLHGFSAEEARSWGLPPDLLGRMDLGKRIPKARKDLERVKQLDLGVELEPLAVVLDEVEARKEELSETRESVLVHGDLYSRHLLVVDAGDLCGVIDWGDVHVGSAAVDLAIVHSFLSPEAHAAFLDAYGPVSDLDWQLARFRAVYHSLLVVVYAEDVGDEALLRESLWALENLAATV